MDFFPIAKNGKQARITLAAYGGIYSALQSLGLLIVGVDFYSHIIEVEGKVPPNWRPYQQSPTTAWLWDETDLKWSQISHGAHRRRNGRLWDLASRISHQMRVCAWRLRQISEAYGDQLAAKLAGSEFSTGQRFEDGFTWLAYLSIQSFLVDACVLRDYLAEFSAYFVYAQRLGTERVSVSSMSLLKKKILDQISDEDTITSFLKAATSEGGWLKELGEYRDLVVHSAPLAKAQQKMYAVCEATTIGESGGLPSVRFPIPNDPHSISKIRATGDLFKDCTLQFEAFVRAIAGEMPNKDGLSYAHDVTGKLASLSAMLADKSPVLPEMVVFDESNIIGPIRITNE